MSTWSGVRKKLETEYLAQCLQGRIQYYATTYTKSHDREGRTAIRLDGKVIIRGCYWEQWKKAPLFPKDEKYDRRIRYEMAYMDDAAVKVGVFLTNAVSTVPLRNLITRASKQVSIARI